MDEDFLKQHVGKVLELHFADGYAAIGRILAVLDEPAGAQLLYEILEVLQLGLMHPRVATVKGAHVAAIKDIIRVQPRTDES